LLTPTLRREDGWLLYSARVPKPCPAEHETLLAWSGELPGGCKFARGAAPAELHVSAELPALAECAERVAVVAAGFAAAAVRLGLGTGEALRETSLDFAPPPDLAALTREVGWPFEERADGTLAVDLTVPGAYVPALVEAHADRIAVEVEIARMPEPDGPCRAALAALLLRVNGAFRMVRAVQRAPESRALLEVSLPRTASPAGLAEALAALAVAARHCALEARLLAGDTAIARTFLDRSGMLPPL
jgi:hypothetical protein